MTARTRRPAYSERHLPFVRIIELAPTWRSKEDYPCCASKRDELGRLPVGDCGPDCLRRIERLAGR